MPMDCSACWGLSCPALQPRQDSGDGLDACCNKSSSCFQQRPQSSGRICQAFLKIPTTVQRIAQYTGQHYFGEWRIKTRYHFHVTNKPTGHTPGLQHWCLHLAPSSVSAPQKLTLCTPLCWTWLNCCFSFCSVPRTSTCTWCLFGHLQLDWRAMPWAGCWGASGHPGNARWICKPHYQLVYFLVLCSSYDRSLRGPSQGTAPGSSHFQRNVSLQVT